MFLVFLALTSAGCSWWREGSVERLAVLRFENLTGDPALEWMGRGIGEALARQLGASPERFVLPTLNLAALTRSMGARPAGTPGISAQRNDAGLAGANRFLYGYYERVNGQLRVTAYLEDPARRRILHTATRSGPARDGMLPVAAALAKEFGEPEAPLGTASEEALRHYVEAMESASAGEAAGHLEAAVQADPGFGAAWVLRLRLAAGSQGPAGAAEIVNAARPHRDRFLPLDQATLDAEGAALRGDAAGRDRALDLLGKLQPSDPAIPRQRGEIALRGRDYETAIPYLVRAAALQPDDVGLWNHLGYARAFAGDLEGAVEALRRYEKLRPDQSNPLDSLGDAYFLNRKYAEAERFYLQAHEKTPTFLNGGGAYKAAQARLMTGDLAGADRLFGSYLTARQAAQDPLIPFRRAQWEYLTGRRKAAVDRLERFAASIDASRFGDAAARAWIHAAIWNLELGNRERAREQALRAAGSAGPGSAALAKAAVFLTEPQAGSSEWAVRAERTFPEAAEAGVKAYALGYALLFAGEFRAAAPLFRDLYERSDPFAQDSLPVLLAWTYMEAGRKDEAGKLLRHPPLPQTTALEPYHSLYFPRYLYLRGAVAELEGRTEEAQADYGLFARLSGPERQIWDRKGKTMQAVGR